MSRSTLTAVALATLVLGVAARAAAQPTVFVVRHAERADAAPGAPPMMASDPDLSNVGKARAEALAAMLRDVRLSAIYATEFKRTQQTAAPTAARQKVAVTTLPSRDTAALIEKLKTATGNVLVVGHSNTVPEIVKALGGTEAVTIGDADFDNIFIVRPGSPASVTRLHMPEGR